MIVETSFWHDYEPFFNRKTRWAWIDFTFITINVERAYYVDRFEFHIGALGLHMGIDFLWGDMEADRATNRHLDNRS